MVGNGNIDGWSGVIERTWYRAVVPAGRAFAEALDEIRTADRYDPFNHAPFFSTAYTAIVDTLPIYVSGTNSYWPSKLLWAPKYKRRATFGTPAPCIGPHVRLPSGVPPLTGFATRCSWGSASLA